jgi:hypothetical protein
MLPSSALFTVDYIPFKAMAVAATTAASFATVVSYGRNFYEANLRDQRYKTYFLVVTTLAH